ncbi:SH3-like domain-containing protein [Marinobacter sp. F3R11]|uniref:SH3-like domain-containing protein n=1 Tax=Marinobacter sp. F3R11 TaxID=2267231 RepID=UPI000DE8F7C5|nr:SH3-like domain-containing protein [Marinobacter sp. F3R11]RBW48070.1 nitrile hydratase [Marinobacter sp. F3R11]
MRGYHDIGGEDAGPVPKEELPWLYWEKKVEAIRNLLGDATRRLVSLDELRHGFESFGIEKYQRYSFYRRRLEALIDTLEIKGVLTREELEAELAQVKHDWTPDTAGASNSDKA